jgi:hypothetical protein
MEPMFLRVGGVFLGCCPGFSLFVVWVVGWSVGWLGWLVGWLLSRNAPSNFLSLFFQFSPMEHKSRLCVRIFLLQKLCFFPAPDQA